MVKGSSGIETGDHSEGESGLDSDRERPGGAGVQQEQGSGEHQQALLTLALRAESSPLGAMMWEQSCHAWPLWVGWSDPGAEEGAEGAQGPEGGGGSGEGEKEGHGPVEMAPHGHRETPEEGSSSRACGCSCRQDEKILWVRWPEAEAEAGGGRRSSSCSRCQCGRRGSKRVGGRCDLPRVL